MVVIAIILTAVFLSYIVLIICIVATWKKQNSTLVLENSNINFSILIPVRNEEENISTCIQSILDCNYSYQQREIIVINDNSDDNTLIELYKFGERIKVVNSKAFGKKAAISEGINISTFDYIVTTDADCIVPKNWLLNLSSVYSSDSPSLITGLINVIPTNVYTSNFEYLETAGLMAVSNFGIKNKLFYIGNGANFSFTKKLFYQANGFQDSNNLASGDDVFLLKKAEELNHKIVFLQDKTSIVKTRSQKSWKTLLDQRKRWATKTHAYANTKLLLVQGIVFLMNISLPFLFMLSLLLLSKNFALCFLVLLIGKFFIDFFYLKTITKSFDGMVSFKEYIKAFFINLFLYPYMSFHALFPSKYNWKNRTVN